MNERPLPAPIAFFGGALLAAVAGYVNTAALAFAQLPVTHVTGTVSRLSDDLVSGQTAHALSILALIAAFIAGAALAGALITGSSLRIGRRYGVAMIIQAGLLACAGAFFDEHADVAVLLAAASAGLQNAMASSYGGLIVRTTHLTGIATDLGALLGRWLRTRQAEPWKFGLLATLFVSFFGGGVVGALAAGRFGAESFYFPAALVGAMGVTYYMYRIRNDGRTS